MKNGYGKILRADMDSRTGKKLNTGTGSRTVATAYMDIYIYIYIYIYIVTFTPSAPSRPGGARTVCVRLAACVIVGEQISGCRRGESGVRGASRRALAESSPGTALNAVNKRGLERSLLCS